MEPWIAVLGIAVVVFASTNIDDIFVLLVFFSDPKLRSRDIVLGQFVGIAALYGASVLASLISLLFKPAYVGLLGLVPLVIGGMKLYALLRPSGDDDDEPPTLSRGSIAAVAAVTIGNGGDNIGIYTPLFATSSASEIAAIGVVFAIMTGVWCLAAHWFVKHPAFGAPIRQYGERAVPLVLIALGLFILYDAGTFALVRNW